MLAYLFYKRDKSGAKEHFLLLIGLFGMLLSLLSAVMMPPQSTQALSGFIDPNADGTVSAFTATGGGSHFVTIDDGTRQPSVPNTSDHISAASNSGAVDFIRMSSIASVQTVTQITVWVYHNDVSNALFTVQLYDDDETTTRSSASDLAQSTSDRWDSATFTGLSLTQTQLDSLSVRISISKSGAGQPSTGTAYALYADVTYSAGAQISLSTDGAVAFGSVGPNTTIDTTAGGVNDVQTVSIDGDPVNLDVRSTTFGDGGSNTWNLGGSSGNNQVHWEFSPNGSSWTTFAAADTLYALDTNVPNGATRNLYLRLTTPTTTGSLAQHGATVTIVATIP